MSADIRNDESSQRYETTVDGQLAYVAWEREGDDVIVFTHTIVPDEISGKGVGQELVKYALDDARAKKLKVVPQCSFVAAFLRQHPEYEDLVATGR